MKKKLPKFIRILKKIDLEYIRIVFKNHILPALDSLFTNILIIGSGALIILLSLLLFGYDFNLKYFFGSLGLYFVVYEVKSWIDSWLRIRK